MMRRFLSVLLVLVMIFTMLPHQAFASEAGSENAGAEITATTAEPSPEEAAPAGEEAAEEVAPTEETAPTGRICEEGCILAGEEEHLENGGGCFVWTACTLTEGCEGPEGHQGECYGARVFAPATITVRAGNSTVRNAYIVVGTKDNAKNDTLYVTNSNGIICNPDGSAVVFEAGTYYIWYGTEGAQAKRNFYYGSVTVNSGAESVALTATNKNTTASSEAAITEDQWNWATCVYYNTDTCDHIHIRVAGSYRIDIGGAAYDATVSNPEMIVYVNGAYHTSKTWSGTTNYEWTYKTNIPLSSEIEVHLTMDLTYRDATGTHTIEDVEIVYNNMTDRSRWIAFIAICDGIQGFDFTVSVEDVMEELKYYNVVYQWRVYNLDGSVSNNLPAGVGSHGLPAPVSGLAAGTEYVYNTGYVAGTSYHDYENGLLYTFHGWDTYSHSATFNVDPSAVGYTALDDGDADAGNNKTIPITGDTWINGYWTVSELPAAEAYLLVHKDVVVSTGDAAYVTNYLQNTGRMFIRIDPGIDKDGDGKSQIDVDYPGATADGGYRINVYQYETPFAFHEYQAEVPGYTRTVDITVTGGNLTLNSQRGDSAAVAISPEYDPEQAPFHLGTVTYTNTYTKNIGEAVSVYPSLYLLKSASDGGFQDGVGFTLYSDAALSKVVGSYTTADGGQLLIDFTGLAAGTYYLKETAPLAGYKADPCVYSITLTVSQTKEELRWNAAKEQYEYVQVSDYAVSVAVPSDSTAVYSGNSLHIYNDPILGSLRLSKTVTGLENMDDLNAVVIVHGPITRDSSNAIADIGSTWTLNLNSENAWNATISELPVGEYLIHESFASVHGYTWTGVTYGNLNTVVYNGITSGIFQVSDETEISLNLKNTYEEWASADFYIKKVDPSGNVLANAEFTLSTDAAGGDVVMTRTTGVDGYAYFNGFTVPEDQVSATYYLRETKAPAGFYLDSTVYKVEIKAVTNDGVTTYEPKITLADGAEVDFNNRTDLLTVTNNPVLGELTVTKAFAHGLIPDGLTSVSLRISGPNGYSKTVELNNANSWSATLNNLPLGEYTITELDASVPGYTWTVAYSSHTVTLAEAHPGLTVPGTGITGLATVTNTYVRNEVYYEVPTALTVKKVDENSEALAGAVFRLDRLDKDGQTVIGSVSFTTGADGTVVFDLLSGFVDENGTITEGKYILSETKAPDGYEAVSATWTVTVKEKDGVIRWELNENKNLFEGFWDWIVGNVSPGTFQDGVLTIQNVRSRGRLTIRKDVTDPEGLYANTEYSFTLDCSDDAFDRTFTLKAGESYTVENIPWGTTYALTEDTTGAAFTSTITDEGSGRVWAYETGITVSNTYAYTTHNNGLNLVKTDGDDNTQVIPGAGFTLYADEALTMKLGSEVFSDENGALTLPIEAAGTYFLVETTTPAGYHPSDNVYVVTAREIPIIKNAGTADAVTEIQMHIHIVGLTGTTANQIDYVYNIDNTAIKTVVVTVEKVWVGSEGVIHPESVEAVLYRDGEVYDTVVLSAENDWSYTWETLTDEFQWTVDEPSVPAGYTKNVTSDGHDFTITNTREFELIDVDVTKVWYGADVVHPASVKVTLYRDGAAYDTVTLSASNGWSYTWENLTDEFQWTVDEPSVPSGYNKTVRRDGYSFTITNTHEDNPRTGDYTDLFGMGTMAVVGAVGFGATALMLVPRRKKEEDDQ